MIVDSPSSTTNMIIPDTTKSNCIDEDDDEVSVIAVRNGTGARPKLYSAQRLALAPLGSIPANATICPLSSTTNSFPFHSPNSSTRRTLKAVGHRKTNGFPPWMMGNKRVENRKIVAPITNPSCDIEILLEEKPMKTSEVEIVADVHCPKDSSDTSKKTKSLSYSHLSKREKVNYSEELITGASSWSLPSRSSKSFTACEVVRLREKAQYQLLLEKVVNRSLYKPAVFPKKSPKLPPQIDLTNDDGKPGFSYHFKKEKVEDVSDFFKKYYKPCALVPHSSQNKSYLQKRTDSEDDIQIINERPRLKPKASSIPSDMFSDAWINDLKRTLKIEEEKRYQHISKTEEIIEFYKRRRDAKIAERNLKLEEMRLAGVILPEQVEMEEDVLPEITPEMESIIARALASGYPPDEILIKYDRVSLSRSDISTLSNLSWLNDQIINIYLTLIAERSKQEGYPSVHVFSSFFYTSLKTRGPKLVLRWTKRIDIFTHDLIIVPLHLEMHWALLVVDNRSNKITYFDSMGSAEERCLYFMKGYLASELMDKQQAVLDPDRYQLEIAKDIPKQMNGSDCGMFTLKYAEYLSRDAPFTFSQENMPYFRRRMVYELLTKQIL